MKKLLLAYCLMVLLLSCKKEQYAVAPEPIVNAASYITYTILQGQHYCDCERFLVCECFQFHDGLQLKNKGVEIQFHYSCRYKLLLPDKICCHATALIKILSPSCHYPKACCPRHLPEQDSPST